MGDWVSDDVWRQLDPRAGDLTARTRRRITVAFWSAVLVAIVLGFAWYQGLLVPRLAAGWNGVGTGPGEIEVQVTVTNRNGWAPVEVLGVGRDGSGLDLVDVTGSVPRRLAPGEAATFTLAYRVTDCAAVTDQPWPVPVRVARPWGTQTIRAHLPTTLSDGVEWQRYFADRACRHAGPAG